MSKQDQWGLALLNIAELDVCIGTAKDVVQRNLDAAKSIFNTVRDARSGKYCDIAQAYLYLREEDQWAAHALLQETLKLSRGKENDIVSHSLEKLGDPSCWNVSGHTSTWTTVFLAHAFKSRQKLECHKALQFLGDLFATQGDKGTAISLFTIALEGFTCMDVHRSKAECMLELADIYKEHKDLVKAVELWKLAKPLFERSSQAKQVKQIEERLACVSKDVLQHHRNICDQSIEARKTVQHQG
ncbi:hypothetical protein DFH09DRAFT_1093541 [Mycena vulgaris]|nr:hypothetical protein DFH09DRAFT_1093541 [Mycena vulgaris]